MWELRFTKRAQKDAKKLATTGFKPKAEELLAILEQNLYENPPTYEQLKGDLQGAYSRRINIQHRLGYEVLEEEQVVKVLSIWTHYE